MIIVVHQREHHEERKEKGTGGGRIKYLKIRDKHGGREDHKLMASALLPEGVV